MTTLYCPICAHSNSTLALSCASCSHPLPASKSKSKAVTILLWLFLGNFGAHRFYLGDWMRATLMLMMIVGGLFYAALGADAMVLLLSIGVIWVFCDGIYLAFKGKDYYRGNSNG